MIFLDSIGHLISDSSIEELHIFAKSLGLKREWFQDKNGKSFYKPHYDLTTSNMRVKAEIKGAIKVDSKEIVKLLKRAPYQIRAD